STPPPPLPPEPLHSRYVVRRISHQREIVRHLRRSYAESFGGVRLVHPMLLDSGAAAAGGVEHCGAGAEELKEIFVSRYDDHLPAPLHPLHRERSDHIVRFIPVERDTGNAEGGEQRLDPPSRAVAGRR